MVVEMGQLMKAFKFIQKISSKDFFLTGIFGGLAGTIAMDIFNLLSWRRGKTEALYGHIAGSLLMNPLWTHRRRNFTLGQITHLITGAALGLPITYLFKMSGRNHHLLKGAFMGLFSWLSVYVIGKRFNIYSMNPRFSRTHYSGIISNLIYGMTASQAIVSLSPNLFSYTTVYQNRLSSLPGEKEKEFGKETEYDEIDTEKDSEPAYIH